MRPILDIEHIHAAIHDQLGGNPRYIEEIKKAIAQHPVVVVGMKQNPFVKRARQVLNEKGIKYEYLEYGSYFSQWRLRLAIKMWTGYVTFPQIFVAGTLIGGNDELRAMLSGDVSELPVALKGQ
ncbi:MAG: glutaredoxin [Reinekea sp.]